MKYNHINQITENEIKNLVEEKVQENTHLEYKKEIKFSSDRDKKELLADVCSFSNSNGGIIIYGIEEEKDKNNKNSGLPKKIIGLKINTDEMTRSLEESIRKSIEPVLIGLNIISKTIDKKTVMIFFVPRSSNFPHRVKFKGINKFYKRANASRYEIPIEELRKDFLGGVELSKRISQFRSERITKILSNDTPVKLKNLPKMLLHIIPVNFFDNNQAFEDLSQFEKTDFKPIGLFGSTLPPADRLNFDGYVTCFSAQNEPAFSYTQVFRNAVVEAVDIYSLTKDLDSETPAYNHPEKGNIKPSYEEAIIKALKLYCSSLTKKSINGACIVFLSLLGVKGYKIIPPDTCPSKNLIDEELLILPDIYIEDMNSFSAPEVMKPVFDMVWNACGYSGSKNYDEKRKRNPHE